MSRFGDIGGAGSGVFGADVGDGVNGYANYGDFDDVDGTGRGVCEDDGGYDVLL